MFETFICTINYKKNIIHSFVSERRQHKLIYHLPFTARIRYSAVPKQWVWGRYFLPENIIFYLLSECAWVCTASLRHAHVLYWSSTSVEILHLSNALQRQVICNGNFIVLQMRWIMKAFWWGALYIKLQSDRYLLDGNIIKHIDDMGQAASSPFEGHVSERR